MPYKTLFPFSDYWWLYAGFTVLVAVVLALSLRDIRKNPHDVTAREAGIAALFWLVAALGFNVALYLFAISQFSGIPDFEAQHGMDARHAAEKIGLEFLSGYFTEKALAVDNLFVFIVIFRFFGIPGMYQRRVLFYGLFGAIVLRAIFIAIGSVIMDIHWVMVAFGVFLIYQGIHVLIGKDTEIDPEHNWIYKFLKRWMPLTPKLDGDKFFTRENGKLFGTPLFVALIFVEITDIMFAFDSVPAIFGLTKEPLIVFTSNIFAVIDLRALYFLLIAFIDRFHYLSVGLSFVLIFIGTKMAILDWYFAGHFPTELSLFIVLGLIAGSMLLSLVMPPKKEEG